MADKKEYKEAGQSAWKERQAFLLRFSDTLRSYNNQHDIGKAAVEMLAKELALDRCYCAMISLSKDQAAILYQSGNSLIPPIPCTLSRANFPEPLMQSIDGPFLVNDTVADERLTAVDRESFAAISFRAVAACTIRRGKKDPVWSLVATQSVPRNWTAVDIMLLEEAAERLYGAIENARALTALAESEKKYRTLFNSIDECFCIIQIIFDENGKPVDYLVLEANRALYELTGLTDVIGKRMRELAPAHEQFWYDKYGEIALTGEPARFQHEADALNRWYDVYAFPMGKPQELKLAVLFKDITERKHAEKRQVFLLRLSDALRPLADPFSVQNTAMELLAKWLGVMHASYFEMEGDGDSFHVAGHFKDQAKDLPERMRLSDFSDSLVAAYQSGRTVAVNDTGITGEWVKSPETYARIGVAAWAAVPLLKHGKLVAWIGVNSNKPRVWSEVDLQTLNDVAKRTWDALERTRAEQALRDAELKYRIQLENDVKKRTRELQESRDSLQTIFDERLKAEEERNKTYLLLKKSEETASLGSWEFNRLTGQLTWSDGMYRLFDLNNTTPVTPIIYLKYTVEKSLAKAEKVIQYIQNSDADFEETLEINISGKIKVLRIKGTVVRNGQGYIERVLGVDQDISEMRGAEEKIKKMEQEQQLQIFRTSLSTLEEERHRISESLNNGIGQLLYGIKINMSSFRHGISEEEFNQNKAYINDLLTQAIIETRRVSHELMPTTLEQFGLKSAIDDICRQLSGEIEFNCHISVQHNRLEKYMELAVYRTTQELMTNVVKHAKATACEVMIIIGTDQVKIVVSDNGRGMPQESEKADGIGLASIRSKIELLDGRLTIASEPGKGTHIEVIIPHQGLTQKPSR
ncbi:GAF domain-containing sensor histidine kinase [Pedobacter suwonensis]|uniref:GAF domain-containing sensor histidine kinase n=1 Tax=Pedobacter suwonensis TaxID=332999 RepID=UPI0011A0C853|nr:GAF domain-containing protein [Pedobacter suwonensis]